MSNKYPKVNYIGNKERLASWIGDSLPIEDGVILDLFAGGGSVSYYFKKKGFKVIANEPLYASYVVNKALIENKDITLDKEIIKKISLQDVDNKFRETLNWMEYNLFYPQEVDELSKFVFYSKSMSGYEKYILQSLIRRAMIRKLPYSRMNVGWDSIKQLRDEDYSYKKYKRRRSYHNKTFEFHILDNLSEYNEAIFDNGKDNKVFQMDYLEALNTVDKVDLIYLDPPYPGTMNNYSGFYGAFDNIFDKKINITDLTNKLNFLDKLDEILRISEEKTKYVIMSINNKTTPSYKEIRSLMRNYGHVETRYKSYNYRVTGKDEKNKSFEILLILKYQR